MLLVLKDDVICLLSDAKYDISIGNNYSKTLSTYQVNLKLVLT